jgi:starch-binding outer membrane protein, SusD/RagB family
VDLSILYHPDEPGNEEIIFSINYDRADGFGNPIAVATIPYQAPVGLVYPNVKEKTGIGLLMVEPYAVNKFDANDKRKTELIRETKYDNLGTVDTHVYSMKYIDPNTTFNGLSGANIIILRYADVLLSYAEALNENGKSALARTYVNLVRRRAGISDLPEGLSKEKMFKALADERQKEFLLEGDRWFDLRHRGINFLKTEMATFMPNAYLEQNKKLQILDRFVFFPVPESQIQIKPVLQQNTGY